MQPWVAILNLYCFKTLSFYKNMKPKLVVEYSEERKLINRQQILVAP